MNNATLTSQQVLLTPSLKHFLNLASEFPCSQIFPLPHWLVHQSLYLDLIIGTLLISSNRHHMGDFIQYQKFHADTDDSKCKSLAVTVSL